MKRARRRRIWGAAAIALLCIVAVAWWQRQALARLVVIAGVEAVAHVRISFDRSEFGLRGADMQGVKVISLRGEPIARIERLQLAYDLHDLYPGGKRRFGLQSVDVNGPALTLVRHADGSYNVPLPNLSQGSPSGGPPLDVRTSIRNGSIDVIDESAAALPDLRRLYVRNLDVAGTFATAARSTYVATLRYGESSGRLYPIAGRGTIDSARGYIDQEWTARALPSPARPTLWDFAGDATARGHAQRRRRARIRHRRFGRPNADASFGNGMLDGGRIAIAGLAKPIDDVRGPMDVFDDGLLTNGLSARIASIPLQISGGIYGLAPPAVSPHGARHGRPRTASQRRCTSTTPADPRHARLYDARSRTGDCARHVGRAALSPNALRIHDTR